jgi:hypothetical protein
VNGFLVSKAGKLYGPFETANEAAEWMTKQLGVWHAPWHVLAIYKPM